MRASAVTPPPRAAAPAAGSPGGPSLRALLGLAFGLVALLAAGVAALAFGSASSASAARDAHRGLDAVAARMADTLDRDMAERWRDVLGAARHPAVTGALMSVGAAAAGARALFAEFQALHPEYAWLGVADAGGRVLAASGGLLEGADVSSRPWFRGALAGPFAGDVHEAVLLADKLGPRPEPPRFVDVAVPVAGPGGAVAGVLGAHLHWDWARAVEEELRAASGGPAGPRGAGAGPRRQGPARARGRPGRPPRVRGRGRGARRRPRRHPRA